MWKKATAVLGSVLAGAGAFAQTGTPGGADPAAGARLTTLIVLVAAGVAAIAILVALATRKRPPAQ